MCAHYDGKMNITFALDEQLIAAAKRVAARHDTTISALVRTSLEQQVALDADVTADGASGVMRELIRIVLPDTGPLISLALGNALDLLLLASNDVRLVLTDVVEFEATHRSDRYADAVIIQRFLQDHAQRLEILPTTIGTLALADLKRRALAGEQVGLSRDIGELSITNFVISLRTVNPGDPMLVIIEDDWFAANAYSVPGNIHLLSTSAWLDGLEALGQIPSAAAVRAKIQAARPNFRADFLLGQEADKIQEGTEWRSRSNRP